MVLVVKTLFVVVVSVNVEMGLEPLLAGQCSASLPVIVV